MKKFIFLATAILLSGGWFTSLVQDHPMIIPAKSQFNWLCGFWREDFKNFSQWEHIMDRGSHVGFQISTKNNEHFWQVWFNSHQRFQRRFKCEKLTEGRRTVTHDKSSHGLWPGELKKTYIFWYDMNWYEQHLWWKF